MIFFKTAKKIVLLISICSFMFSGLQAKTVTLPDVTNPASITVNAGNLFLTEGVHVYIYSLKDFKLLKKFGKKGEGPKEFMPPFGGEINIHVTPQSLMVISGFRLSYFDRQGNFKKEIRTTSAVLTNRFIRPLGNRFAGSSMKQVPDGEKKLLTVIYNIYDEKFNVIKEFYRATQSYQGPRSEVKFNPVQWSLLEPSIYVVDDVIYLGHYDEGEKGVIRVFDASGKKLRDIHPPYEKVPFTARDRESFEKDFKIQLGQGFIDLNKHLFDYTGYFPPRQWFTVSDGKIYIQTFKTSTDREKTQFLILDLKGKLLQKLMLPLKRQYAHEPYIFTISGNTLYQVAENEDEGWDLHVTEIK